MTGKQVKTLIKEFREELEALKESVKLNLSYYDNHIKRLHSSHKEDSK